MANEFKVKNGLIVDQGGADITGSSFITGSLTVSSGITGSLFGSASYALTASYALNAGGASIDTGSFATTGSNRFIGNQIVTGSLTLSSSAEIELTVIGNQINTGSITATQGFTGSLFGTASWANNAVSASFASTASYWSGSVLNATSASFASTASYALNGGVTQLLAGPNITLAPTNGLGQVTISSTAGGGGFNTATGSYGSFYDTTIQTNLVANIPRSMSLNTTDITNGVSISGSTNPFNTYIKTENAGVYNIQFSAQVEKTDSGIDEIVIWLRKNGIDLTDTATTITLSGNNDKQVAAWNWFVTSAANDYYQIIWISADTGMILLAETISATHPGIPSVIVTANRVDQFLSNTGSFSGSFNGSLFGTASWANNATTASYITSSNVYGPNGSNSILSSSFALTASYVVQAISASFAATAAIAPNYVLTSVTSSMLAPYVLNSQTSSFVTNSQTGSFITNSQTSSMSVLSASFASTAALAPNYVLNSVTASMLTPYVLTSSTSSMTVLSSSFASTASSAENFTVRGTLTAQTIVVQTITSSIDYVTGSSRFGSLQSNTHQFTGSVSITGSLSVNNAVINSLTSSYAMTASYWSGSVLNSTSASYAATAALAPSYVLNSSTASFITNSQTSSFVTNSQTSSMSVLTSSYAGTASLAPAYVLNSSTSSMLTPYVLTSVTSSMLAPYVLSTSTSSFITNSQTSSMSVLSASFASTASSVNTLNQNVIITGVLSVGTGSIGPNENTITLGARDSANEGGQIGFNSPGGTYTSASFIDNWSNYIRILRGTNATSTGLVAQWNLHTLQMELPGYTNASSFVGTATANLAVDSSGKVITVSTTGGSVFPYTGNAVITGSLTVTQPIYVPINGGMYFQGGDDAALYDINVVNTLGVYGVQDSTIASIKIGSGGGTISGRSGNIGIGTINPGATLHVQGNVSASSFTGSLFGTSSWSDNSRSASYATTASFAPSYVLNSSTSSFVTNSQTGSFITNSQTSSMTVLSASFAATTSLAPAYVLNSSTSSMLTPYVLTSITASMLSPYVLSSNTGSFVTNSQTGSFITNSQTSSMSVATASYVLNAVSSSYAATAALAPNYVLNLSTSSMLLPYVLTSVTSSMLSPYVLSTNTGSFITNSQTSSMSVLSASFASTASSAENFTVRGTLTAQTIVVQTITSSIDYVTGSTRFGSTSTSTHQFTGSVSVTGSLRQTNGSNYIDIFSNVNGSSPYIDLFYSGVQGARLNSYASVGGSFVNTSGYLLGDTSGNPLDVKVKSLYAANGIEVKGASSAAIWLSSAADNRIQFFQPSIAYRGNIGVASGTSYIQIRTGQATNFSDGTLNTIFDEAGSVGIGGITSVSASAKLQVDSITKGVLLTRTDLTSNISLPAQGLITYLTGSTNEGLWYYSSGSIKSWTKLLNHTGSQSISGSLTVTQGITGSLLGTSSWANNSISSSYITASNVIGNVTSASYAVSSSFALSASYAKNSPITIADEGTVQGTVTFLNFIGSAVTATVSSNTGSITITGGSGGGLATKSGAVTNTSFTGTPRKATVTFSAAFPNTSYGIVVTGADLRSWTIESKVAGSFIINTNSNAALTGDTYWVATAYGETA